MISWLRIGPDIALLPGFQIPFKLARIIRLIKKPPLISEISCLIQVPEKPEANMRPIMILASQAGKEDCDCHVFESLMALLQQILRMVGRDRPGSNPSMSRLSMACEICLSILTSFFSISYLVESCQPTPPGDMSLGVVAVLPLSNSPVLYFLSWGGLWKVILRKSTGQ